ncbi:hypothetical protein [uncultured Corynebacterium sp.]|uniref:hypothetical protein n=1 Tax=uncultured Corynebacterium sp. TaxID=159447 RepID=UPI0025DACD52|nr:hypothetical protein [uncultured Corynebacterium sp.]
MADVGIPPLVAADGSLAVVYGTAAYLFGKWSVTLPDGYKKVDSQGNPDTMEYGRGLGYVGQLDNPPAVDDLGARRWLRADISTHYDIVRDAMSNRIVEEYRATNVPETFDAAEKRTSGDHLFDGTIGPEGMGKVRLGVDFFVGDEVPVLVGGVKLLSLPVTEGVESSEPGAELVQSVRVGGELTEQPAALLEHETAVMQVLAQESIQRRKEAEQRRKEAEQRRKDEEQWRAISSTASTALGNTQTLDEQRRAMDEQQDEIISWSDQITKIVQILQASIRNLYFISRNEWLETIDLINKLGGYEGNPSTGGPAQNLAYYVEVTRRRQLNTYKELEALGEANKVRKVNKNA